MDDLLFAKIKNAAIQSIKSPGSNISPLPQHESTSDPEIYVFRHGETFDNINRIFSGWRDSKLTDVGQKQAEQLSLKLKSKKIDLCIVSPLARSKDTAKIALKFHPDVVFEEDPRIIERNYGELTGKSKERMMESDPDLAVKYRRAYDFPPPRGESIKMVEERVFPFCRELVERVRNNNINVAISCHGNSMRAIRRFFEGLTIEEAITFENPLAQTFAQYVIKNSRNSQSEIGLNKNYLKKLTPPSSKIQERIIRS